MKFVLMMSVPPGTGDYESSNWTPDELKAQMNFLLAYNKDLKAAGEYVDVMALAAPSGAKLVRADDDGTPITDGPFPETKEFLAGYWLIDVENEERAYQLAAKASAQPGRGGKPLNMPIEVRRVMKGPS